MDWSFSWFEKISVTLRIKHDNLTQSYTTDSKLKRNVRCTPNTVTVKRSKRNKKESTNKQTPKFIITGNLAPSPHIIKENMMNAYLVTNQEINAFFNLLDKDEIIKKFLNFDVCITFADRFHLASIFAYFKRCNFEITEYNRKNFFLCLYLSHDMEEDNEDLKYELFPWALGSFWREQLPKFMEDKALVWARMNYRAIVSFSCCKELMSIAPNHQAWSRIRQKHHGKAIRVYAKSEDASIPKGPKHLTKMCDECRQVCHQTNSSYMGETYFKLVLKDSHSFENDDSPYIDMAYDENIFVDEETEQGRHKFQAVMPSSDLSDGESNWLSQETFCSAPYSHQSDEGDYLTEE